MYVGDDAWCSVGAWVYENFDCLSGVSFLPRDNGTYRQAPYEEITKEQYEEMSSKLSVDIDWTKFKEEEDNTTSTRELNCSAGVCNL